MTKQPIFYYVSRYISINGEDIKQWAGGVNFLDSPVWLDGKGTTPSIAAFPFQSNDEAADWIRHHGIVGAEIVPVY